MRETTLAKQIVHDLRHDEETRRSFSMDSWIGKGTWGTVGCIAGTALMRAYDEFYSDSEGLPLHSGFEKIRAMTRRPVGECSRFAPHPIVETAQALLGIEFTETAWDLFVPCQNIDFSPESRHFEYLPTQARPDLSTIDEMRRWAKKMENYPLYASPVFTPDVAAYALERVAIDGVPYCNWAEAFERERA